MSSTLISKAHVAGIVKMLGYTYSEFPREKREDGRVVVVVSAVPDSEVYVSRVERGRVGQETLLRTRRFGNSYQIGRDDEDGDFTPNPELVHLRDACRLSIIHCCVAEYTMMMKAGQNSLVRLEEEV